MRLNRTLLTVCNKKRPEANSVCVCCIVLPLERYCLQEVKGPQLALDADISIKIADFCFRNEFTIGNKWGTFCGILPDTAPEHFQGQKYNGHEVGVWILRIILYTWVSEFLLVTHRTLRSCGNGQWAEYIIVPSACPWNVNTWSRNFSFSILAREAFKSKSWRINWWECGPWK